MYDKIKEVLLSDINKEKKWEETQLQTLWTSGHDQEEKIRNSQYCKKKKKLRQN